MDRRGARQMATNPAAVAQTLCDLVQMFPAAATTGVQWNTLEKKYEERCGVPLNIAALGHSTALSAASALLWDVLRLVDREDEDNPVVAVEESSALTARPGYLACWPSLYDACCDIVQSYGVAEGNSRCLLLSQLKPYLQKEWHSNFSECGLNYFSEQGKFVSLKKMKHLVTAVLRWRNEYREQFAAGSSKLKQLDAVLARNLVLEQSKTHNDWLLRFVPAVAGAAVEEDRRIHVAATEEGALLPPLDHDSEPAELPTLPDAGKMLWSDIDTCELDDRWSDWSSTSSPASRAGSSVSMSSEAQREMAALRAENARLRSEKEALEQRSIQVDGMATALFHIPSPFVLRASDGPEPEVFDDPFEPPPQKRHSDCHWSLASSTASPGPSDFCWSGIGTPGSSTSGAATPAMNFHHASPLAAMPHQAGFSLQACAFVPVAAIPSGIVNKARSLFERADGAVPSFFVRQ